MKEITLRKWHHQVAVYVAPLILFQTLSGLFLSFEWLAGFHSAVGQLLPDASGWLQFWDWLAISIHYGGGRFGAIYHTALGLGLTWLVFSGIWILFKIRRRKIFQ